MGKPKVEIICECCGVRFIGYPDAKYCSAECKKLFEKQLLELHRTRKYARHMATESENKIMSVNTAALKFGLSYGIYAARNEVS